MRAVAKANVVYECSKPGCGKTKEFSTHPRTRPTCCGKPMKQVRDACCEPGCGPSTCG